MSNLDFLEISRNFKSYYQALRDAHYYLRHDPDLSQEELQAVTKVLSKLIYGFIRIKGVSFREMDREQFKQEFNLFHQDFLNVIQNSGENNVEFDQFADLIDEIIGIAVKRTIALGKIEKVKQQSLFENVEIDEVTDDIVLDEINEDVVMDLSSEDENKDAVEEMVEEMVDDMIEEIEEIEEIEVIDETQETVAEVRPINNTLRTFSTDFGALNNEFQDETITNAGRTFSTDVETLNNEAEVILYEIVTAEEDQPEPINEVIVAEAVNEPEPANETPKKVKYRYIDAAPVVNNYQEYESSDNFRFRPRRRRNR